MKKLLLFTLWCALSLPLCYAQKQHFPKQNIVEKKIQQLREQAKESFQMHKSGSISLLPGNSVYRPDSMLGYQWNSQWILNSREKVVAVNDSGKILEDIFQKKDENEQWQDSTHYVYEFNQQQNETYNLVQLWNIPTNSWVNKRKSERVFDGTGLNSLEWNGYRWDASYGWILMINDTCTYYNDNKIHSDNMLYWDGNHPSMLISSYYMEYTPLGNPLTLLFKYWRSDSIVANGQKVIYSYNANENTIIEITEQEWDTTANDWVNSIHGIPTYDNGLLVELNYFEWNSYTQSWDNTPYEKDIYSNDESGRCVQEIDQYWDGAAWVNDMRYQYQYDQNNNVQTYNEALWFAANNQWLVQNYYMKDDKGNYLENYSMNFDSSTGIANDGSRDVFNYNDDESLNYQNSYTWDSQANHWAVTDSSQYYYSALHYGINENQKENAFCNFPNPYTIGQTVNCNQLKPGENYRIIVYNSNGAMVNSQTITGGQSFAIRYPLPDGLYLITVSGKEGVIYRNKLLIVK